MRRAGREAAAMAVPVADQWLLELLSEDEFFVKQSDCQAYKRIMIALLITCENSHYRKQCEGLTEALLTCPEELDPLLDMLFVAMIFGVTDPLAKKKTERPSYRFSVKLGDYPEQEGDVDYRGKHSIHIKMTGRMNGKALMQALLEGATRWSNALLYHNEQRPYLDTDESTKCIWSFIIASVHAKAVLDRHNVGESNGAVFETLAEFSQERFVLGNLLAMRAGKPQDFVFTNYETILPKVYGDMRNWVANQSDRVTLSIQDVRKALRGSGAELVLLRLFTQMGKDFLDFETFKLELQNKIIRFWRSAHLRQPAIRSAMTSMASAIADLRDELRAGALAAEAVDATAAPMIGFGEDEGGESEAETGLLAVPPGLGLAKPAT